MNKEGIENCLRTFAMVVLYHKEILDSDIELVLEMILMAVDEESEV